MSPLRSAAVARAWNAAVPPKYALDADLVEANLMGHPLLHATASEMDGDAFVAVKRSAAELYAGPDPKVAHLALFGAESAPAVRRAIDVLRTEGYAALVVGQDSGHFLPGAPTDVPWMGRFLRDLGFVPGGLSFDLENDLSEGLPLDPRRFQGSPYDFRPLAELDVPALDAFLAESFPGRWRYDAMRKVEAEGPDAVFGLFRDETCHGFALLQREGCRRPIGGAVWRNDLGAGWGSLGPIGISEAIRKEGLGAELLRRSLDELRRRGARRTIIDWTGLLDFYGAEGFAVTRAYRAYRLELEGSTVPGSASATRSGPGR